ATDGNHGVDGFDSRGHGLTHRLAVNHAGGNALDRYVLAGGDGTFVVDGQAQGVDHAANHAVAGGHGHDLPRPLDLSALFHLGIFAHDHHAYLVFFQVHGDSGDAVAEVEQLAGHDFVQAVHARDTVAQRDNGSDLVHRDLGLVVLNLLANELRDFVCFDLCHRIFCPLKSFTDEVLRLAPGARSGSRQQAHPFATLRVTPAERLD